MADFCGDVPRLGQRLTLQVSTLEPMWTWPAEEWFGACASGEIPPASALGVTDDEITVAGWVESVPEHRHDGDLLRPYL